MSYISEPSGSLFNIIVPGRSCRWMDPRIICVTFVSYSRRGSKDRGFPEVSVNVWTYMIRRGARFGVSGVEETVGNTPAKAFSSDKDTLRSADCALVAKAAENTKKKTKNRRIFAVLILTRHYVETHGTL